MEQQSAVKRTKVLPGAAVWGRLRLQCSVKKPALSYVWGLGLLFLYRGLNQRSSTELHPSPFFQFLREGLFKILNCSDGVEVEIPLPPQVLALG